MDLRTVQDRVIVAAEFVETTSSSGIFLGEGEMKFEGVVLAVGPKVDSVIVGDRVMFFQDRGHRTNVTSTRVLVLRENDLMGIVEE